MSNGIFHAFRQILFFCGFSFTVLASSKTIISQDQLASQVPPMIEQLKDKSSPCGLNLPLVYKRQEILRRQKGIANDISTTIMLFEGNKPIMFEVFQQIKQMEQNMRDIQDQANKETQALNDKNILGMRKYSEKKAAERAQDINKKKEIDLSKVSNNLKELNIRLDNFKQITKKQVSDIMQIMGLSSEQVARIPGVERRKSKIG